MVNMNTKNCAKTIFSLIAFYLIISCSNKTGYKAERDNDGLKYESTNAVEEDTDGDDGGTVYVCASGKAIRYHTDPYCRGLRRCSREIIATTVEEAQDNGRTPCHICAY